MAGLLLVAAACTTPIAVDPVNLAAVPSADGDVITADSVRIHYRVLGAGPDTVLLLQGGPAWPMEALLLDLAPLTRRHALVAFDPRGTGQSQLDVDSTKLGVEQLMADIDAVRIRLRLHRTSIVAHDWGALVAGLYHYVRPGEISRMVLLAPYPAASTPFLRDVDLRRRLGAASAGRLDSLLGTWRSAPDPAASCAALWRLLTNTYVADASMRPQLKANICAQPAAALRSRAAEFALRSAGAWDVRPALKETNTPILVIHGDLDPIGVGGAAAWACAAPRGLLLRLDDVAHFPHVEARGDVLPMIDDFLRDDFDEQTDDRATTCGLAGDLKPQ